MIKQDMQTQVLQMLFNEVQLEHMPHTWSTRSLDSDTETTIKRFCTRAEDSWGQLDCFDWLDDKADYCENKYDCYNCAYECDIYRELHSKVADVQIKFRQMFPTSSVDISIDACKSVFYLNIKFELSDFDFETQMKKLEDNKKPKKKSSNTTSEMSDKGKEIVDWLQQQSYENYSAREVAEGLFCSSRSIPGAMKKLETDGYIEVKRMEVGPNRYALTQKGIDHQF